MGCQQTTAVASVLAYWSLGYYYAHLDFSATDSCDELGLNVIAAGGFGLQVEEVDYLVQTDNDCYWC